MSIVSIIVDGQKYNLSCDEGQEDRLHAIGRAMDRKAVAIRRAFPQISDNLLLIMIGVLISKEAMIANIETNPHYEENIQNENKYADSLKAIQQKIETIASLI